MSDWTWEYLPDAANVVGGLTQAQVAEVESLVARIADAVGVHRIGAPFDVREAVSNLMTHAEGPVLIWFLEDYRENVVLVARVHHLGAG
jgi:plasmid stabilization system protein ParE